MDHIFLWKIWKVNLATLFLNEGSVCINDMVFLRQPSRNTSLHMQYGFDRWHLRRAYKRAKAPTPCERDMVYKRHALGVHHVLLVGHLGCLAAIHEVRHVVHKHFEADTEQGVDVFLSARLRKSELQVSEVAQDQRFGSRAPMVMPVDQIMDLLAELRLSRQSDRVRLEECRRGHIRWRKLEHMICAQGMRRHELLGYEATKRRPLVATSV